MKSGNTIQSLFHPREPPPSFLFAKKKPETRSETIPSSPGTMQPESWEAPPGHLFRTETSRNPSYVPLGLVSQKKDRRRSNRLQQARELQPPIQIGGDIATSRGKRKRGQEEECSLQPPALHGRPSAKKRREAHKQPPLPAATSSGKKKRYLDIVDENEPQTRKKDGSSRESSTVSREARAAPGRDTYMYRMQRRSLDVVWVSLLFLLFFPSGVGSSS